MTSYDGWKTQSPFDYPDDEYGAEIDEKEEYFEKHKEEIARKFQQSGDEDISIEDIIEFLLAELWSFYCKEY